MFTKNDVAEYKIVDGEQVSLTDEQREAIAAEWNENAERAETERQEKQERERLVELRESVLDQIAAGEIPKSTDQAELKSLMRGRT